MFQFGTYLTLAACALAAPLTTSRQPTRSPQGQTPWTGVVSDSRLAAASPGAMSMPAEPSDAAAQSGNRYSPHAYVQSLSGGELTTGGQSADFRGFENRMSAGTSADNEVTLAASSESGPARALMLILASSGVPNQNGQIIWPPILRRVRAEAEMQRVEAQLQLAAEQVIAGGVNPKLLDEIRLTVEEMDRLLKADRASRWPSLPADMYDDAGHFLQVLKRAPRIVEAAPPTRR
jgi:hypothetical protein